MFRRRGLFGQLYRAPSRATWSAPCSMSAASSRILLTLCVAVISLPALVPSQVAIDSGSVCSAEDDAGPARLSVIREEIISKLSHFLSFNVTSQWREVDVSLQNETRRVDPALVTAYEAVSRVLAEEDSAEPTGCAKADRGRGTPVFAKRLSLFFAVNASAYVPGKQGKWNVTIPYPVIKVKPYLKCAVTR